LTPDERAELSAHADFDKILGVLKEEQVIAQNATWNNVPFYHAKDLPDGEEPYHGRIGIHEILPMSTAIKDMVMAGATADAIEVQARKEGMLTMLEDGLYKAAKGLTTVEEVLRVINE
jgi:type II secretory ATPase GspE/PulE/Tfp pilus assembly ATPase PilB-like protein